METSRASCWMGHMTEEDDREISHMQDENQCSSKGGEKRGRKILFGFVGDVVGKVTGNAGTKSKVSSRSVDLNSRPTELGFDSVDPENSPGVFMGAGSRGETSMGSKDCI